MTKKPPSKRTGDSSRLGAYLLPGRIKDPLDAIIQAEAGERIGLGTMWVSERWGNKDIGAICGAVTQVAPSATIAAGTTHFLTRHPAVLASMAMTLQALSNSKFMQTVGITNANNAQQEVTLSASYAMGGMTVGAVSNKTDSCSFFNV